jgi:hypothetical protein
MPIARCPKCGGRQLIDQHIVGQSVACVRCDQPFTARAQHGFKHLGEIVMACCAIAAGVAVSWYFVRPH